MRREHRQVLREHRPDRLEDEATQHLGLGCTALLETPVDVCHELDGLARDLGLVVHEHGPAAREEEERVEVVGQLDEVERGAGLRVDGARLPDLEAMERAQHDVARRGTRRRPGALPVAEHLLAVHVQSTCLARALHLDDADARPEEVHEAVGRSLLEARAFSAPVDPIAG